MAALVAAPPFALDLATQRVTATTPIGGFCDALGVAISNAAAAAALKSVLLGCGQNGGVLVVDALRSLDEQSQQAAYDEAGLGANFGKTINLFLRYAGETTYSPRVLNTAADTTMGSNEQKKGGPKTVAFAGHKGTFDDAFKVSKLALPNCLESALPIAGHAIHKARIIVREIVKFLVIKYQIIHWDDGGRVTGKDIAERLVDIIVDHREHIVYEGESPVTKYEGALAKKLLLGKIQSKITQDRNHVAKLLRQPGTTPRVNALVSQADAERMGRPHSEFGYAMMYPVGELAEDMDTTSTPARDEHGAFLLGQKFVGQVVKDTPQPTKQLYTPPPVEPGTEGMPHMDLGTEEDEGGAGFTSADDFDKAIAPKATPSFVGVPMQGGGTDADLDSSVANAAEMAKKGKADKAARAAARKEKLAKGMRGKNKENGPDRKTSAKKQRTAPKPPPPPPMPMAEIGVSFEEHLKNAHLFNEDAEIIGMIPKEEVEGMVKSRAGMDKFEGYGEKNIRVYNLMAMSNLGPMWFKGFFCHLEGAVCKDKGDTFFWVKWADGDNARKLALDLADYDGVKAGPSWVLVRTNTPEKLYD